MKKNETYLDLIRRLRGKIILEKNSTNDKFKVKDTQNSRTPISTETDKDIINDINNNGVVYSTENGAIVKPYGEDDITTKPNNTTLDNIQDLPINDNL